MSDSTPDVRRIAAAYHDRLKVELAKVEDFLAIADDLMKADAFPATVIDLFPVEHDAGQTQH